MTKLLKHFLVGFWLIIFTQVVQSADYSHLTIDRLLEANETPDGVVFELIAWDDATWSWAAPMIADLRSQLQTKYPGIDVAIVSHGGEQFQLTQANSKKQPQAIAQLASLSEEGVNLHVCGAHSLWNEVAVTDYIDIVDVSPSGPAQVNDYIKLGYRHILLRDPPR